MIPLILYWKSRHDNGKALRSWDYTKYGELAWTGMTDTGMGFSNEPNASGMREDGVDPISKSDYSTEGSRHRPRRSCLAGTRAK